MSAFGVQSLFWLRLRLACKVDKRSHDLGPTDDPDHVSIVDYREAFDPVLRHEFKDLFERRVAGDAIRTARHDPLDAPPGQIGS